MCINKSFASMVYIKFRTSGSSVAEKISEPEPAQESIKTADAINNALKSDDEKLEENYSEIINKNVEGEAKDEEEGEEGEGEKLVLLNLNKPVVHLYGMIKILLK